MLSSLIGVGIAEIALRIAGYSVPEFYQPDPIRGYALRPNMEGWYRKEGESYVRINSDGLRDREHPRQKPANTFRIAVLGDSYAEAFQVPVEAAFWNVMQNQFTTCNTLGGREVEVINFGVSGYGTAIELLTLRNHVWQYSPDLVLLAVTTNNDISDNSRELKRTDRVPYFVYRDGQLVLDDSFKQTRGFQFQQSSVAAIARWFRDHSRVIQASGQALRAFKIYIAQWRSTDKPPANGSQSGPKEADKEELIARSQELGVDNLVYLETKDPVWQSAWTVTEGLIEVMRNEVTAKGARFAVITLSNGPQVYPDQNVRQGFMKRFAVENLFYPDDRVEQFCRQRNIQIFKLAPDLQAYADQNHAILHGFPNDPGVGHWNETGHRVAGGLIASKLCASGVLN